MKPHKSMVVLSDLSLKSVLFMTLVTLAFLKVAKVVYLFNPFYRRGPQPRGGLPRLAKHYDHRWRDPVLR